MSVLTLATSARAGIGGARDVIPGAELALFLAGDREEHNRPRHSPARLAKAGGHFEDRRHAGRVVHRAVVDPIAGHGFAHADVIEVRRQDHEFVAQVRVGAAQDAGHVLRLDVGASDSNRRLDSSRQREAGKRPSRLVQRDQLCSVCPSPRTARRRGPDSS